MQDSRFMTPHRWVWCCALAALCSVQPRSIDASAQQLLDRVLARVNGEAITLTDLDAAIGLGLVEIPPGEDRVVAGTQQLIDRQLQLAEVQRFPPPEPSAEAVETEIGALRAHAGGGLTALMRNTGLDERRLRDLARDNLRIQAYLVGRFGAVTRVSDEEVSDYYRAHPAEFTRDGAVRPFVEVEPVARQRAGAARRRATLDRWVEDLRMRAEIVDRSAQ